MRYAGTGESGMRYKVIFNPRLREVVICTDNFSEEVPGDTTLRSLDTDESLPDLYNRLSQGPYGSAHEIIERSQTLTVVRVYTRDEATEIASSL
jgi:hypothetical protein